MRSLLKILGVVAAALVLLVIGFIAVSWVTDRDVDELAGRWAPEPSAFVEVDGMPVHYRDQGPRDAPHTLLLLHGTLASLHTWEGWVAALTSDYRVVSLDLPAFGLTGPFPDSNDYSLGAYMRFLDRFLDALDLERAVVAGNSFGGELAWEMALAMPERVEAIVLVAAAGYPLKPKSITIGSRIAEIPALRGVMNRMLSRRLIKVNLRILYGDPDQVTEELVDRYYELTIREGNREALFELLRHVGWDEEAGERIDKIRQPTLIIWGGRDPLIEPEYGHRFKRDIDNADLVIFEELGHMPQEEDPAATVAVVLGFLREL
jgi:pimeloyl-ACP methyl ester carboxylesterase